MPYNKKSPNDFKKDLDNGLYQSATGARRAVGKFADWGEPERGKARKMIDKHFGEASTAPPKKGKKAKKKAAPKKAKGKKATKKKAKAAAKKVPQQTEPSEKTAKRAPVKKAAAKKTAQKKAPAKKKGGGRGKASKATTGAPSTRVLASADVERNRLGTYEQALSNLRTIRDIDPEHDVGAALQEATEGIRECLSRLRGLQSPLASEASSRSNGVPQPAPSPAVAESAPAGLAHLPGAPGV